jgi:hypothetical protein
VPIGSTAEGARLGFSMTDRFGGMLRVLILLSGLAARDLATRVERGIDHLYSGDACAFNRSHPVSGDERYSKIHSEKHRTILNRPIPQSLFHIETQNPYEFIRTTGA